MLRRPGGPLAAFTAFGVFWGAWGVLLPDVKGQTGASVTELGAALLAIGLSALPAMLLTGRIVDRIGARASVPALLLFGAAIVLPGLCGSVWQLALALVLVGATSGALDVVINVAATGVEASGGPRIVQLAHGLFSAGFLVAAVLVGLLRAAGAEPLPVLAGVSAVLVLTALLNRGASAVAGPPAERRSLRVTRRLVVLGALCAIAFVVEGGIENWSALFLESEHDASPAAAGLGPGLFAAAMVAGRSLGHGLEPRIGDRARLTAAAVVAASGLAVVTVSPSLATALAGFLLGGLGISVAAPTLFGAAGRGASDAERGTAVASVTTISYLGFLGGPPLIGAVSGALDLRAGMAVLAGIAVLLATGTASFGGSALPLRRLQHPPRGPVP